MTSRELINTGNDKRFVRRDEKGRFDESDEKGRFDESDDAGKSLAAERRTKAKHPAPSGQGDRGDRGDRKMA
jgi:hypothetical protein